MAMKKIKRIVRNVPQHWVGDGFPVRSLFSYAESNEFDPFLLLDYAGPHEFEPGEAKRGVGEHPHRGFETVTILYQGELEHRDSSGSQGIIGSGDVQWMTAASGIVHDEFHSQRFTNEGGTLEMVQLWVNLPAEAKKSPPKYQDLRNDQIPKIEIANNSGCLRVIAGDFKGNRGPAEIFSPLNVWDLQLNAGISFDFCVPDGHTSLLITQSGALTVNAESVSAVELLIFEREGEDINLESDEASRVLILTGEPLREPVYGQGPFVMNSREEIQQAIRDYKAGKMGKLS
jgi:redox-sensitive bicupin YhaK (pirin superfamily)